MVAAETRRRVVAQQAAGSVANAKVGAERNSQKSEVIYNVNDLDAAPLEWRIRDVQKMAKVSTVTAGSITLGVAVGPSTVHRGPALGQGRRHSSNARTRPPLPRPAHGICPPQRECGSWLQKSTTRLGNGLSNNSSHGGQYDAGGTQCRPVRNLVQKERETSRLLHTSEPSSQPSHASKQ